MITINDLKKAVDEQIKRGNGDKIILMAGDEEGNYFAPMFYLFTSDPEDVVACIETSNSYIDAELENCVILG